MARAGQMLENPVHKERFTFLATGSETAGELLRAELVIAPGGAVDMPHVHWHQEERWTIRSGRGRFRIGAEEILAGPGDTVIAEPGIPHGLANAASEDLSMILELRPALRTDLLFETVAELAHRGAFGANGRLHPLWGLAVGRAFREEVGLPHVPRLVQRALLGLAAPVVRLTRYDRRIRIQAAGVHEDPRVA